MANKQNGFRASANIIARRREAAEKLKRMQLQVGWMDGAQTQSGTPFSIIAQTLCYGREKGTTKKGWTYPAIPARNFEKVFSSKKYFDKVERYAAKGMKTVLEQAITSYSGIESAMAATAQIAAGQLRKSILDERYQENADATIASWARRHSGTRSKLTRADKKELVDTGAMVQHITARISVK